MKTHFVARALIVAALAMSGSARASFHLYDIQEVFSNGDGTVQFVELFTTSGSQQFLNGLTLTFQINTTIQNSKSLSQLPGDSANKAFLVGTANLATLYGVTPDFVIAANFFSTGANNFLNFAGGTDRVNLSLLPTNGTSSLNGQINNSVETSTSVNALATPTNFAGQTATIPEPAGASLVLLSLGATAIRRRRGKKQPPPGEAGGGLRKQAK